jgi:hypothetical protein
MKLGRKLAFLILCGVLCANGAALLFDNGPLITHAGAGGGGADASALQQALGMTTYGYSFQNPSFRLADDFVVPSGGWTIGSMTFFGYQTNSTTTSTFTAMTLRIWDGAPDAPGSSVVFGDAVTNRMTGTTWSGIYRVLDDGLTATTRPIMANTLAVGATLAAGAYWADVDAAGTLAGGPWAPPITILGQTTTGNGKQFSTY